MKKLKLITYLASPLCASLIATAGPISFTTGAWDNNTTGTGYLESSDSGQITTSDGVTTTVTFGDTGTGKLGSWSHEYINNTNYEGFTIGSSSSGNVNQNGSGLVNAVVVDFTFSSPVSVSDLVFEDVDSYWNTPSDRQWIDAVYIEGWTGSTIGSIGTGDVAPTYTNIGSDLKTNTQAGVNGITGGSKTGETGFHTNIAGPNDTAHMFTAGVGTAADPIQSMRVYLISRGNANVPTGHTVVINDSFTATSVPEPSSLLLLSAAFGFLLTKRKR